MTDSYFLSCWVVSIGYYTHCVGISFQGHLRVRFIWWDQHRFGNSVSGGYPSSEILLHGEK
jgi:hypothetical protein